MAKRKRSGTKILGISDKGWDTIWKGFKWWLIAGAVITGVVIVGGVVMVGATALHGPLGATRPAPRLPPVRIVR